MNVGILQRPIRRELVSKKFKSLWKYGWVGTKAVNSFVSFISRCTTSQQGMGDRKSGGMISLRKTFKTPYYNSSFKLCFFFERSEVKQTQKKEMLAEMGSDLQHNRIVNYLSVEAGSRSLGSC